MAILALLLRIWHFRQKERAVQRSAGQADNEAVISNTGVVKRPEGRAVNVKLTATVTFAGETVTREFTATVAANYAKIKIKEVKDVAIVSYVGKIPSLPATVEVVYDNDTTGKEKVAWPTNLKTSDFASVGTKTITGTIVDTDDRSNGKCYCYR
ncbi:MAG: Ig-like domain-containing protein [Lachnoclostridium sp.]